MRPFAWLPLPSSVLLLVSYSRFVSFAILGEQCGAAPFICWNCGLILSQGAIITDLRTSESQISIPLPSPYDAVPVIRHQVSDLPSTRTQLPERTPLMRHNHPKPNKDARVFQYS